MLAEIEEGKVLTFKGSLHNEKVVICTSKKTFEVRNAEQSNSLLVVPGLLSAQATSRSPLKSPQSGTINKSLDKSLEDEDSDSPPSHHTIEHKPILKIFYEYLECRLVHPRIKKVQDLLQLTLYSGPENEHSIDRRSLFTRRQLFKTSQCSEGEFEEMLKKIRSIKIDGFMRLLSYEYEYRVVTLMISLIVENSWKLDEIEREATIEALDGIIPNEITQAIVEYYTESSPATGKFCFKEAMISRIIAQNVLQEGLKFHIDEFFATCQSAMPEGMQIQESHLGGIAIVDRDSPQPSIRGLFEENMSMELADRLRMLFQAKGRWTLQEISPYVEVFTTPQLTITSLLAKNVRSHVENGTRVYYAKHQ
jgi:sister chromatid cohesion protein DCC1